MATTWSLKTDKTHSALDEDLAVDVCIIGGGLAGIWAAYMLSKEGKSVVLLERDRIGRGETMNTTAFITSLIDTSLSKLVDMFGKEITRRIIQSGEIAIDLIEQTVHLEDIDCEFIRKPLYIYAKTNDEMDFIKKEESIARELGLDHVSVRKSLSFGFSCEGALEVLRQGTYHPLKFLYGIRDVAEQNGVRFFEQTEVSEITGTHILTSTTKNGKKVESKDVVIATYEPMIHESTHFKKGMYISYVSELCIPKDSIAPAMYLDLNNPYHYVRIDEMSDMHDRMLVGGEDHRAELRLSQKSFDALAEYIEYTFPELEFSIERKWRGHILESSDGLALIGEIAPHKYVATAFSGNGMTYAAIGGMLIDGLITKKKIRLITDWAAIYDPKRKISPKAFIEKAKDYVGEFFGGAAKNIFK